MIYLAISTEYIVIASIVVILFLILNRVIIPKLNRKNVLQLLQQVSTSRSFQYTEPKGKKYDFLLEDEHIKLFIKVVYVPSNSAITINSRNTWSLTYGGSGSKPGKRYSHQRYLDELITFLNYDIIDEKKHQKVVLVYPRTDKIQRHLNESDIAILKYKDIAYGYKVITYEDFENHFEDLL